MVNYKSLKKDTLKKYRQVCLIIFFCVTCLFTGFVHSAIPASERAALIALYNSTNGDSWTNNSGWKDPPLDANGFAMPGTEGSWYGITVASDHVTQLNLQSNQLSGSIPPELGNLSNLLSLWLTTNQLSGSIPPELGNLSRLTDLRLDGNQLNGSIPPELGNLSNLLFLWLGRNQLSGSIPPELGNLLLLQTLSLDGNQLSGSIPIELINLSNLIGLSLGSNKLSGSIPPELGNLLLLQGLTLDGNQLSGSIPPELGNLSNLYSLRLNNNQLCGNIPWELGNISHLRELRLDHNYLSGRIPDQLAYLKNSIRTLKVGYNCLSTVTSGPLKWLLDTYDLNWDLYQDQCGSPPTVITNPISLITISSAVCGGDVTSTGGGCNPVIARGVCWSTSSNPTVGDSKTTNGSGTGSFTSNITGLNPNTLYHVRAYAANSQGTSYGIDISFTTNPSITSTYKLNVNSTPGTGVSITVSPNDNSSQGDGTTNFFRTYNENTNVTLTAPSTFNGMKFLKWTIDGVDNTNASIQVTMDSNHTVIAYYESQQAQTYTLSVQSSPDAGVSITVSPDDNNSNGNGTTNFTRTFNENTNVTLTAPSTFNGMNFLKWTVDGVDNTNASIQVTMDINHTVIAYYESQQAQTYTLSVKSSPDTGVGIKVSPDDNNSNGNGTTNFSRTYNSGTSVNLTAPSTYNNKDFSRWTVGSTNYTSTTVQVSMTGNKTATAIYETSSPAEISLNRSRLNYGGEINGPTTRPQSIIVSNTGGGILNWSATADVSWIILDPSSGINCGEISVSVNISGLSAGTYTGALTVSDPDAANSPRTVLVSLEVYRSGTTSIPFGVFATPIDGSTVMSSIPVTGWALDDIEVTSVKIYRAPVPSHEIGMVYIGDAVFVEGPRPDVEQAYPDYPLNYKAGWGYMMLTNFLPNGGNGTFYIHAVATDKEGNQVTLGTKAITCDNANAVKPFGAIDTPTQGGIASGSSFINWGWVLTPQPNSIPTDGLSIKVWVDGINIGQPTYNNYRSDIAQLFPGYNNSDGAIGYFFIDTTAYDNGLHTIQWTATDSGGNTDGIGSRYFTIQNTQNCKPSQAKTSSLKKLTINDLMHIPSKSFAPLRAKSGFESDNRSRILLPDDSGISRMSVKETGRIEIQFGGSVTVVQGSQLVDGTLTGLPIGSTVDPETGKFTWSLGPGFLGKYHLVFVVQDSEGEYFKEQVEITVEPRFEY